MAEAPGRVVLLTPQGRLLTHEVVAELALEERLIVICGHYEGVDERVRTALVDDEISIGDYVLSGGEPAAIVLIDAVARHQPGVLGSEASLEEESHAQGLLEYPQYTRPAEYRGMAVPDILLSGHHADIATWRRRQSIERTARRRPDLLTGAALTPEEHRIAAEARGDSTPAPRLFRVIMPTSDIGRSVAFYSHVTGQPGERVAPARHYFRCGDVILAVVDPRGDTPDAIARPNPDNIYFSAPDLPLLHERVKHAGASWIEDRIRKRAWGEHSFYARDPDGNPLCFVEERTAFTGGGYFA